MIDPQALYFEDPLVLEFEATVTRKFILADKQIGATLNQTYFYPTGGGQDFDTGSIGAAQVVNVYKEAGDVVHVLDQEIPLGKVTALINRERRVRHMQHHTAQHLLTQCFLKLFDLDTLSAHIGGFSPSTLDLPAANLSKENLGKVETLANNVIFENRAVRSYSVTPEKAQLLPLRRQSNLTENIRVVEIESFDYTPCGGTHCLNTGMIGLVKILKTEHPNSDRIRISFAAGLQACQLFDDIQGITTLLSKQLGVATGEITTAVQHLEEQLQLAQSALKLAQEQLLLVEAKRLTEGAEMHGSRRLILASFEKRPGNELRILAGELKKEPGIVAVLGSFDGQKYSLFVSCAPDTGMIARELLNLVLSHAGGRGGGDALIAQGGGTASEEQFKQLFDIVKKML